MVKQITVIRTTRFNGKSNPHITEFSDYVIRKNNDDSIDLLLCEMNVNHKGMNTKLEESTKQINKTYKSANRCIGEFLTDMEEFSSNFTYIEIEIKCFISKKRYDKEFKIDLCKDTYQHMTQVKRFLDLVMNEDKMIESLENGEMSVALQINDKDLLSVDISDYKKKLSEITENKLEEAISVIQDKVSESISDSVSTVSTNTRKKKGLLRRMMRL